MKFVRIFLNVFVDGIGIGREFFYYTRKNFVILISDDQFYFYTIINILMLIILCVINFSICNSNWCIIQCNV